MKRAVQIYALTVCFFTMACLAITTGLALWNGLKIAVPSLTLSKNEFQAYQSDEAYLEYLSNKYSYKIKKEQYTLPEKHEVTSVRERAYSESIASERHGAIKSLLFQLIIILVDLAVYWFHWRMVRDERIVKPACQQQESSLLGTGTVSK